MSSASRNTKSRGVALACALLAALTTALYAQVADFDFVAYDDDVCILENPVVGRGLEWDAVVAVVTGPSCANWTPLAWLSHMLDLELYGRDATGHHLTNVVLHAIATLLLFALLHEATRAVFRSALVAALFAVHPLHVESVAWVAERRDVLSAVFGFGATWAWVRWTRGGGRRAYAAAFALLALGLLSKPMLVTLPVWLLLLDHWPLARLEPCVASLVARVREKLPLFALAAAVSVATLLAQGGGGAVPDAEGLPFGARAGNALVSAVVYLEKTLWPSGLAIVYPHPNLPGGPEPWSALQVAAAAALLAALTAGAWRLRRRHGYLLTGWLWYGVGLLPVIGLVQVGEAARADRYTYLPLVGIFLAAVWGVHALLRARGGAALRAAAAAGVAIVAAYSVVAWGQIGLWRDSFTLFEHTVRVTEGNFLIHYNLGNLYKARGDVERASHHYEQALAAHPTLVRAHYNYGNLLRQEGRLDEAIEHYREAALHSPDPRPIRALAATARQRDGDDAVLIGLLREMVERWPGQPGAHLGLGQLLERSGALDEAIAAYERALALAPDDPQLRENLERARRERAGAAP